MKLIDQVCTEQQAIKLKELGVEQAGYYCYAHMVVNSKPCFNGEMTEWEPEYSESPELVETGLAQFDGLPHCSVFTVAELGVMLPPGYDTMFCTGEGWRCFDLGGIDIRQEPFETEAECRAHAIIRLLECNIITPEDVNARLCAE